MIVEGDFSNKKQPGFFEGMKSLGDDEQLTLYYSDEFIFGKGGNK